MLIIPVQGDSFRNPGQRQAFLSQLNKSQSPGMKANIIYLVLVLFFPVFLFSQNNAPENDLAQARQLATSGQFVQAEQAYNQILIQYPNSLDALVGAGYNYSWNKQYDKARIKFETALALNPNSEEALIGQGYNHAWAGNYASAKHAFQRLQQNQSDHTEARKGLGYVSLWEGDAIAAEEYFRDLTLQFPTETEYRIALAQAYLLEHSVKKARVALLSVLQLDSSNRTANELLKSTYGAAAPLELDVWAGYSSSEGENTVSLRTLQLTGQVGRNLRMYLKYDNSLTSDLAALVRTNQKAQALSIGAVNSWNRRLTTRLEYGARILPDNVTQQIFSGEQVYFFGNGMLAKAGGFYGWSAKAPKEWLAYGGLRIPVTRWYAVEPHFFLSQVEGTAQTENRFLLNNQFRSARGYELNLGLIYGKASLRNDSGDSKIFGSYITAIMPFSQVVWGHISFRWEQTPLNDLTIAAAGIKLRLEK